MKACLSFLYHRVLRHFGSGMLRNHNFEIVFVRLEAFRFFTYLFYGLSFFPFSFLFVAVIDLLVGLLVIKIFLRKRHRDRQFLPWSSHV